MDNPLKFRVFHRHLNQRSPTLLGIGSLYVNDVVAIKHLTMTQRVAVVNKGIKVGELEVSVELGCDGIHFGKDFVGEFFLNLIFCLYLELCLFLRYLIWIFKNNL